MPRRAQVLWILTWAAGLTTAVVATVGRFGFNPSDQGYILAQAWQIRHGAVPHLQAISSRPFGSEVLHQVDFWLPGPLYLSSMWLSFLELVVATVLLAALATGRPVRTWGLPHWSLATAAVLVNIHSFPLMAWPTIDGMLLTAGGLYAVVVGLQKRSGRLCGLGVVLCGAAPLTKQSFYAAPVLALLLLRDPRRPSSWRALWLCLLAPGIAYVTWVTAGGGLSAMLDQLLGGRVVYGQDLVTAPFDLVRSNEGFGLEVGVAAVLLLLIVVARTRLVLLVGLALLPSVLVNELFRSRMIAGLPFGDFFLWTAVGILLAGFLRDRRRPSQGALLVLAVAWMVSLSWGYPDTDLVGGSLIVLVLVEGWRLLDPPRLSSPRVLGAAGLACVLVAAAALFNARLWTYFDAPRSSLRQDAGQFAPGLSGIRTSKKSLDYLLSIKHCLQTHPARHVAVLPDNPVIYPLLGIDDPFPQIWMLPEEDYGEVPDQLAQAAKRMQQQGSYLVLFQRTSVFEIVQSGPPGPPPPLFRPGVRERIRAELHGTPITCDAFTGVYQRAT